MFAEAQSQGALLFLDEADGFLRERARALRSWEVTKVNELLVQMEAFDGIFVCATNLMESLDRAAFRRFDLKVHFAPLDGEQRWRMFLSTLRNLSIRRPRRTEQLRDALDRLDGITLGDFAAVARRMRLMAQRDATTLVESLREERRFKGKTTRAVGFMAGGEQREKD